MSSKVGHNQQQGRRTPLSLAAHKHAQQQQQQSNKNNSNLSKIQEMKSEAAAAAALTKNGNGNTNNGNHKEHKKSAQQNGSGNGSVNDAASNVTAQEDVASSHVKNSTANGHKNQSKNGSAKTEAVKEKDNNKEIEVNKEKQKKDEADVATAQQEEKQKNETAEPASTEKGSKSKEATPASSETSNEKQQTPTSAGKSSANNSAKKPATPTKASERGRATPPTKSPASKSSTPSKSPRIAAVTAAAANKSVNESPEKEMPALLVVDNSPSKKVAEIKPTAASTPAKVITKRGAKAENQKLDNKKDTHSIGSGSGGSSPIQSAIPRVYSQISGRRSIRPIDDFTPQMYNSQFRESYRRINTELDVTGNTNTSMNVTVGSEIPNNSSFLSFSLFGGRGRKREHTPPPATKSKSVGELSTVDSTPPKRARLDVHGIFTAMSSPLTLLRTRFSKTTLESSTPAKGDGKVAEGDVQNVSGVSIEEVVCNATEIPATEEEKNVTVGKEAVVELNKTDKSEKKTPNKKSTPSKKKQPDSGSGDNADESTDKANISKEAAAMDVDTDVEVKETPVIPAVGDPKAKQRGCLIM